MAQLPRAQLQGKLSSVTGRGPVGTQVAQRAAVELGELAVVDARREAAARAVVARGDGHVDEVREPARVGVGAHRRDLVRVLAHDDELEPDRDAERAQALDAVPGAAPRAGHLRDAVVDGRAWRRRG